MKFLEDLIFEKMLGEIVCRLLLPSGGQCIEPTFSFFQVCYPEDLPGLLVPSPDQDKFS